MVNEWAAYGFEGPDFEFATGVQDCSRDGRTTLTTSEVSGWVEAWDRKSDSNLPRIPVRVGAGGTCPQVIMVKAPLWERDI